MNLTIKKWFKQEKHKMWHLRWRPTLALTTKRDPTEQTTTISSAWQSLGYVRKMRPRVVVVENVAESSLTGPLTGLLQRLSGYELEGGTLDPRDTAAAAMARTRFFWILRRT